MSNGHIDTENRWKMMMDTAVATNRVRMDVRVLDLTCTYALPCKRSCCIQCRRRPLLADDDAQDNPLGPAGRAGASAPVAPLALDSAPTSPRQRANPPSRETTLTTMLELLGKTPTSPLVRQEHSTPTRSVGSGRTCAPTRPRTSSLPAQPGHFRSP